MLIFFSLGDQSKINFTKFVSCFMLSKSRISNSFKFSNQTSKCSGSSHTTEYSSSIYSSSAIDTKVCINVF
ncbi:hypothetical protein Hanom_Chr12g01171871 [Helianthus anomalus]